MFPFADIATATDATYRSTISFSIFFYSIFFFQQICKLFGGEFFDSFFCGQCCGLTPALFCASASFLSVFGDVCVIGSKRTAGSGTPSPLVCPPTHPQRHLTIFHLGFPPENTHALTHSRTRATFRFLFYFHFYFISGLFFCCFPLPTPSVVGVQVSGQLWKKRTLALLFLDIEKNLPLRRWAAYAAAMTSDRSEDFFYKKKRGKWRPFLLLNWNR